MILDSRQARFSLQTVVFTCMLVLLGACTTIPADYSPPPGYALPARSDTRLAELVVPPDADSTQSFFLPVNRADTALDLRLALTDMAQVSIDAQYYLWNDDESGNLLLHRLLIAADRGVRIRLLVDDMEIEDADWPIAALNLHPNIEIRIFNPLNVRGRSKALRYMNVAFHLQRLNNRMHNKMFLADNIIGLTGGRNIGNEYFGLNLKRNNRDIDVVAVGPIVSDMSDSFDIYWNSEFAFSPEVWLKRTPELEDKWELRDDVEDDAQDIVKLTDRFRLEVRDWSADLRALRAELIPADARAVYDDDFPPVQVADELGAIADATQQELIIVSPYFVPALGVMELFNELKERGVRVVVLTNSLASNNVTIANTGYKKFRRRLLDAGVELHEYRAHPKDRTESETPPVTAKRMTLHRKIIVFDRKKIYIGTLNVGPRSILLNSECGLLINDPVVTDAVLPGIERDLQPENSWRVTLDEEGRLRWESSDRVTYSQPADGFWQRFKDFIFTPLPVENQI